MDARHPAVFTPVCSLSEVHVDIVVVFGVLMVLLTLGGCVIAVSVEGR